MNGCGGVQPLGTRGHRQHFDINQLNREHLRDLPRGSLRRWAILCDTGAVTSVAPRNFADHVPPATTLHSAFSFYSYQSTHSHLRLQRHLARLQQHQLSGSVLHMRRQSPSVGTSQHL